MADKAGKDWIQAAILVFLFLPVFFQLSGRIFREKDFFRSEGQLLQLPLPLASVVCFVGIALLLRLEKRHFGMGFVFAFFMAMMLSVIMSTGDSKDLELARFIFLIQFTLPTFALVLGSLYVEPEVRWLRFEAILLYLLLLLIPLQVIATVIQGDVHLASYLYVFSLYQHLQYLPVIFVAFYVLALAAMLDSSVMQKFLVFLAPWMGIYLAASLAMTAILFAVSALLVYLGLAIKANKVKFATVVMILLVAGFVGYFILADQSKYYSTKFGFDLGIANENLAKYLLTRESYLNRIEGTLFEHLPRNLKERVVYWWFFGEGIFDSWQSLLFGHETRPDRSVFPSAHNYYIDLVYNFGLISLLPIIYLLGNTAYLCLRAVRRSRVSPELVMLILVVVFFALVDNSLKVGFRQPYPGMVMFFFWGVLITRLSGVSGRPVDHV